MNKEDIVRMIHEAATGQSEYIDNLPDPEGQQLEVLTRFAALVAAKEREACAKVVEATKKRTYSDCSGSLDMAAKAIRNRSND